MTSAVGVSVPNTDAPHSSSTSQMAVDKDVVKPKLNLLGMSRKELEQFFEQIGEKKFRAGQILSLIHI